MPRVCTVCTHPACQEIDQALVSGMSVPEIIARYSTVSSVLGRMSLQRHKAEHIPVTLAKAQEAGEVAQADDLLGQLRDLQTKTLNILDRADTAGQLNTALMAIREARGNIELAGKLTKLLSNSPSINILLNPTWVSVRVAIMKALKDHPEARIAVAGSLKRLERSPA